MTITICKCLHEIKTNELKPNAIWKGKRAIRWELKSDIPCLMINCPKCNSSLTIVNEKDKALIRGGAA